VAIMALDSHAKRFLDMVASARVPDMLQLTPLEMRQTFLSLARMVDAKDIPIGKIENSEIPGPAGRLKIRVYTPVEADAEQMAGLVFFHGGGGVFCNLETHEGFCRMLANESGCRIVSVDFRLAPEHKFPAGVEDCYAATKWVVDHAAELNIDRNRIAIAGDSAGGNLAAVVCQLAATTRGPKLALQILFCPITDVSIVTDSRRLFADGYFLTTAMLEWALKHYCPVDVDFSDPRLSPLRATDLSSLPPAHIHTAEFDPLRDEGKAYAKRLQRAGVKVHYTCHSGMIHHFYAMAAVIPQARVAIKSAGAAIKIALLR
jgi:acetyl esterase